MKKICTHIQGALVLLFFVGCGGSGGGNSSAEKAAEELTNLGVIAVYAANGTSDDIVIHLDGEGVDEADAENIAAYSGLRLLSHFDTPDNYDLFYTDVNDVDKGEITVARATHHLYGATECGIEKDFISAELIDPNNIYIMNFTDASVDINTSIMRNGEVIVVPNVSPCEITSFSVDTTEGNWSVDINGTNIVPESDLHNPAPANAFTIFLIYDVGVGSESAALDVIQHD